MIIDSHCHIYPDKIVEHATKGISEFYELPVRLDGKTATMVEQGKKVGIEHFVVFSVATTPGQVSSINRFIASAVQAANGIFTGLGTIHPMCEDIPAVVREILALGLHGVKVHPDFQKTPVDDEKYMELFACCAGKLPVYLHTGDQRFDFSNPMRTRRAVMANPNTVFIGAHLGGWSVWEEAVMRLKDCENMFFDTSSSFKWLGAKRAAEIIREYGVQRVMFGTDFPMWKAEKELEVFFALGLNKKEEEQVLYRNAAEVFGIKTEKKT